MGVTKYSLFRCLPDFGYSFLFCAEFISSLSHVVTRYCLFPVLMSSIFASPCDSVFSGIFDAELYKTQH